MTPAARLRDQLEVVSIVAGLGLSLWLVWTMTPEVIRRQAVTRIAAPFAGLVTARALAAARRREVLEMEFETFAAIEVLTAYDDHRDPDQLTRDLEAVRAGS